MKKELFEDIDLCEVLRVELHKRYPYYYQIKHSAKFAYIRNFDVYILNGFQCTYILDNTNTHISIKNFFSEKTIRYSLLGIRIKSDKQLIQEIVELIIKNSNTLEREVFYSLNRNEINLASSIL